MRVADKPGKIEGRNHATSSLSASCGKLMFDNQPSRGAEKRDWTSATHALTLEHGVAENAQSLLSPLRIRSLP